MTRPKAEPGEPAHAPILVVSHILEGDAGHVGQWFVANGYRLDVRRPRYGDRLPETLANHSGAVVLGGPMSATEPEDYIHREIDWLTVPLEEDKPLLGICLGAQMLALKLGGDVRFHADGFVEVGYHPIVPTPEGTELMTWPSRVYQWHREGFTLPAGAVALAKGDIFENQAFRYGRRAFGIQFHPETSFRTLTRWTTLAPQRLALPGARPRTDHIGDHLAYGGRVANWVDAFLTIWTRLEG